MSRRSIHRPQDPLPEDQAHVAASRASTRTHHLADRFLYGEHGPVMGCWLSTRWLPPLRPTSTLGMYSRRRQACFVHGYLSTCLAQGGVLWVLKTKTGAFKVHSVANPVVHHRSSGVYRGVLTCKRVQEHGLVGNHSMRVEPIAHGELSTRPT